MRKDSWRMNLFAYFKHVARVPFDKNNNNCAQFVAGAYVIMRDDDPFKPYRKYKTFERLLKAVRKDGYENHYDFFKTFLREYDHVTQAKVGDIAVFPIEDEIGFASGIVIGDRVFVLRENGLATMALKDAIKAFEV